MKPKPVTPEEEKIIRDTFVYRDGRLYRLCPIGRNARGGYTYPQIVIGKKGDGTRGLLAHRIIFFMHHGIWPESVDHIDGNRANNRVENLRACTHAENMRNRGKTKTRSQPEMPKGVCRVAGGKFHAYIRISGRQVVKHFQTFQDALDWRKQMERTHYGVFAPTSGDDVV